MQRVSTISRSENALRSEGIIINIIKHSYLHSLENGYILEHMGSSHERKQVMKLYNLTRIFKAIHCVFKFD